MQVPVLTGGMCRPAPSLPSPGLRDRHFGLAEGMGWWQTCLNGSWLFKVK